MAQVGNSKRWIGLGNGVMAAGEHGGGGMVLLFGLAVRSGSFDGWSGDCLAGLGWWMVEVVESLACCVVCLSLPGPHVPPFVFVYDALGPANSVTQKINPMFYPEGV